MKFSYQGPRRIGEAAGRPPHLPVSNLPAKSMHGRGNWPAVSSGPGRTDRQHETPDRRNESFCTCLPPPVSGEMRLHVAEAVTVDHTGSAVPLGPSGSRTRCWVPLTQLPYGDERRDQRSDPVKNEQHTRCEHLM